MKYLAPLLFLLIITGCCPLTERVDRQSAGPAEVKSALYRFHLERAGETRLAGLLALNFHEDGIWCGLLDATGVPLIKMHVRPEGTTDIEYCAKAVSDTMLPEVLGKLVEYIYFTYPRDACSWYAFSCICEEKEGEWQGRKWKRFGPFHYWEVRQQNPPGKDENIEVRMYFSSVKVTLARIDNPAGTQKDERDDIHRTETP